MRRDCGLGATGEAREGRSLLTKEICSPLFFTIPAVFSLAQRLAARPSRAAAHRSLHHYGMRRPLMRTICNIWHTLVKHDRWPNTR